jgi:phage tail-like protein
MLTDSKVISWVLDALQNRTFKPVQINVMLLNEEHQPLKTWNIFNAWPKKWAVSDFNAQENSVVIETLDISYNYFTVK